MNVIKEIYNYREMIYNLVRKDLRTRYKGSVLGFFWTFLNPLLQLVIYTIVFSVIMRSGIEKFYMYLFVALIPWTFCTASIQGGAMSIIFSQDLIKKIYFPRIVLPLATVNAAFVNMLLSMIIVFITLVFSGIGLSAYIVYLPAIMLLEYIFVLGFAFVFSALNVYFRDLEHILGIVTMAWFYLTPIVYTLDMVPEKYATLYKLNPMTNMIAAYRDILYYKQAPQVEHLYSTIFWSLGMIVFGFLLFTKLQKNFVEEL